MSEYQEKHTVSRLIGAPPGYVGYDEAGQLTEAVRRRPYAVVLFDEVEKAHPEVLNVMLQLLDDGRLTDGKGRTVDFRNTVVIMTSNLGSQYLTEEAASGTLSEGVRRQVMDVVRTHFRPEFLNRIDEVIVFHALSREHMAQIIDIQARHLLKRLEDRKIHVELTAAARDLLVREGYDPGLRGPPAEAHDSAAGARPAGPPRARGRVPRGRPRGDRCRRRVGGVSKGHRGATGLTKGLSLATQPSVPRPRESKPGERRPLPVRRPSFSIWYVLGLLLLLAVAQTWLLNPSGRQIPYSEFKSLVRSNQVVEVTVGDQTISGRLREAQGQGRQRTDRFVTTRIEDPKLVEDLEAHQVKFSGETVSRWLPEVLGWIIPLVLLVAVWSFFFRRIGGAEGGVMSFARSRAKIYADDDVKVSFGDVAGVDEAEEELREIVEFLKTPKKYTQLGGRIPKGVLLVGPPGTGKTLLARAVAGEAKVPFFSLSGSEFVEMFVGVGAARVRDLFAQAEAKAPCIVFIDELDALGKIRVQSPVGSHEEREQTLNQLLAEMDGFDSRKAVIIMGATNRPEVLDPALLRPGRFDRQVLVDKPDINGREAVLRIHTRNVKVAPEVDLRVIAGRTAGFAGADLANLVNEAALLAARKDKTAVDMRDFDEAIDRLIAGLEKKRVMNARERQIVAYHESGHAIVASVLPGLDPVHKISIVQRGFGALGYTMQLPLEDRYLMTRTDLRHQLAVLLGGRTAEEIALGEISTGAQNDLQRASDIARAMVTEWGMSDAIGAINYAGDKRSRFLELGLPQERGVYAESTAQQIDAEVKRIMTDAHDTARRILSDHRGSLESVTRLLLEKEVMEGEELRRLLGMPQVPAEPPTPSPATL